MGGHLLSPSPLLLKSKPNSIPFYRGCVLVCLSPSLLFFLIQTPFLFTGGPTLSPSLLFVQIQTHLNFNLWGKGSYSVSTFCSNPNASQFLFMEAGPTLSLSPIFVQIPIQFLFMEGEILLCLHLCLHFLFNSQPNSIPLYRGWSGSCYVFVPISAFCSNPNSIPIYVERESYSVPIFSFC